MSVATNINARVLAGLATVVKSGPGQFTWTDKRWDPLSGAVLTPVVTQILMVDLNDAISVINAQITDLRDVQKADLVALKTYLQSL